MLIFGRGPESIAFSKVKKYIKPSSGTKYWLQGVSRSGVHKIVNFPSTFL